MSIQLPYCDFNPTMPFAGNIIKMTTELAKVDGKPGLLTVYLVKNVITTLLPGETFSMDTTNYSFSYQAEDEIWIVTITQV
jgi:hypothetical protein